MYEQLEDAKHSFTWKIPFDEALGLQLYKECLSWKLVDMAELAACEKLGNWFHEQEAQSEIVCDGQEFVVKFVWEGELPAAVEAQGAQ